MNLLKRRCLISLLSISFLSISCFASTESVFKHQSYSLNKNLPFVLLKDMESSYIELGKHNDNKLYFCFVFETPCFPCNNNIPFWDSIFQLTKDSITCFGILTPDQPDDFITLAKRVNYKLYEPDNIEAFREAFHLEKEHQAITFLFRNNAILEVYFGNFNGASFTDFVKKCKDHIKNGENS